MPTYEYQCGGCKHKFDELQSITAKPLTNCPKCKKKKLKRLMGTGAGLLFKGSGFYITDYRSDAYKASAKSESSSESKPEAKTDGASEKKSADTSKESKPSKPASKSKKS